MNNISQLINNGMREYQQPITAFTAAAPLAIEGGILIKNILKNPRFPIEKAIELKKRAISAFTPQDHETTERATLRISKNVFLLIGFLALAGAVFYVSLHFLPMAAAIPVALTAIFYAGKAILGAPEFFKQFSIQPGESLEEGRKRIAKLILKVAVVGILSIGALALGAYVVYPMLMTGFSWRVSLPFQTKPVVFAEYAFVGLVHLGLAIHNYIKGDKQNALFHLFAAGLAFMFPIYYWNNEMRLHHSFLGLILMALPFRATKFIGSVITFDSSLYLLGKRSNFDFMNIFWGNFPLYAGTLSSAMLAEGVNDSWEKSNLKERLLCRSEDRSNHPRSEISSS